jgi:hypothetical protein
MFRGTSAKVVAVVIVVVGMACPARGQEGAAARPIATPALLLVEREPGQSREEYERRLATLRVEARSRPILESALASHPEILKQEGATKQKDAVRWMADMIGVRWIDGTDFLEVTGHGPTPVLSAMIANAVTDAIIRTSLDSHGEELDSRIRHLDEARLEARHEVVVRRQQLRERMKSADDDFGSSAGVAAEADELREVRKDLRRVRLDKIATEVRLERTKAREKATDAPELSDTVAMLAAQETLLVKAEHAGAEALKRAELARLDFQAARADLARAEERVRAVEDDLRRLKLVLRRPWLSIRAYAMAKAISE